MIVLTFYINQSIKKGIPHIDNNNIGPTRRMWERGRGKLKCNCIAPRPNTQTTAKLYTSGHLCNEGTLYNRNIEVFVGAYMIIRHVYVSLWIS